MGVNYLVGRLAHALLVDRGHHGQVGGGLGQVLDEQVKLPEMENDAI